MRTRSESLLTEVLPPEERVIEAVVARYQRVAPAITRFARVLSGNDDLQVRLGSQAAAGPGEVIIDPGVFQAAYSRHAPVTPTEVALASALHEVIHLIATDFDERRPIPADWVERTTPPPPPEDDRRDEPIDSPLMLFDEPRPKPPVVAETPVEEEAGAAVTVLDALVQVSGSPAEAMFLSIEDARQEREFFSAYSGAQSVLGDLYRAAVPDAMRDARPLGQFALSCFLIVGGYMERDLLQRRVDAHVAAAIDEAMPSLGAVLGTKDPWEVGDLTLDLLDVARRHGLFTDAGASPTPTAQRLQMESDQKAIAETVDAVRIVTPPLQDAESYDRTRQAAQTVSAQAGRKGDAEKAGDPATDQIVRVSESPTIYLPTGQRGKLIVSPIPDAFRRFGTDGRRLLADAAVRWHVAQRRVSGELYPLFLANQRRGLRSGFDAGDLSPYAALLLGGGIYERMFERRDLPTRRSYGVSLLVDGSASMLQPRALKSGRNAPWALASATLGAWTLAHLCNELQIEFEVALFNRAFAADGTDTEQSFNDRRNRATGALRRSQGGAADRLTRTVNHYLVKSFDARWRQAEDVLAGLFFVAASPQDAAREARKAPDLAPPVSMFDKAANVDEFNVAHASQRLISRRVSTRILVVLADGMTRGSVNALAAAVSGAEQTGAIVLGIGIGDATVQAAYSRNQVVEQPDELARAMVDGVRSTLYQTIARMGGDTWWAHSSEQVLFDLPTQRSANA